MNDAMFNADNTALAGGIGLIDSGAKLQRTAERASCCALSKLELLSPRRGAIQMRCKEYPQTAPPSNMAAIRRRTHAREASRNTFLEPTSPAR